MHPASLDPLKQVDPATVHRHPASAESRRRQRYALFVTWVRKTHGWIGLWGALLGLLFGLSGIWLNHRAVLKLPPVAQQRHNAQLALPDPAPASAQEMAAWLQHDLELPAPPNQIKVDPARPVAWTEKIKPPRGTADPAPEDRPAPLRQPERWTFNFGGPHELVQAEYWVGNRSVGVTTTSNGFLATLSNLHKGVGMTVPWILLVDSLAGSMIFLSISGVILWIQMNRRRALGVGIFSASVLLTGFLIGLRL
ncbi:MAG: PepSY-associated TM helix domain-containing protein [Curvibacter sp.]|nr:PepSY-associated TM helix domain-containing protein [Curvibacter sp.]